MKLRDACAEYPFMSCFR